MENAARSGGLTPNADVAKRGEGAQIGRNAFQSRQHLRDTIVHEELHHRWWKKGRNGFHHDLDKFVPNEKFYEVLRRYHRMRGFTDGNCKDALSAVR